MRSPEVVLLLTELAEAGVVPCIVGGWGVDALLGGQTRQHHDLDMLVDIVSLRACLTVLQTRGYTLDRIWEENVWIGGTDVEPLVTSDAGRGVPTAFVMSDGDGREVDLHVVGADDDRRPVPLWAGAWRSEDHRSFVLGSIGGVGVVCFSKRAQLVAHTGYPLPASHLADLGLLRSSTEADARPAMSWPTEAVDPRS